MRRDPLYSIPMLVTIFGLALLAAACGSSRADGSAAKLAIGMTLDEAKATLGPDYTWERAEGSDDAGKDFDAIGMWTKGVHVEHATLEHKGAVIAVLPATNLELNISGTWLRQMRLVFEGADALANVRAFGKSLAAKGWTETASDKSAAIAAQKRFWEAALTCPTSDDGATGFTHPSTLDVGLVASCTGKKPYIYVQFGPSRALKKPTPEQFR